jgi:hypothetical protein
MSLPKVTLAAFLAVVGLSCSAIAQTRSAIVYPEDGYFQTKDRPAARKPASREFSAQRSGDSRPSNVPSHRYRQASYTAPAVSPELTPIPEGSTGETGMANDPGTIEYEPLTADGPLSGTPCDGGDCDGCCECSGEYCNDSVRPVFGLLCDWGHRNLAIFGGVHGYKGPRDRGVNGNFGFQEGVNFGSPLGDPWGCGFQLGFQALQSDISGSQSNGVPTADRHQYFVTAGLFRRAEVGKVQWAVAYDYLYDTYSGTASMQQIRSETGWLFNEWTEIGYAGAYGIGGASSTVTTQRQSLLVSRLDPTDQFVGYIRRYFENGGDGRLYGGITGKGDGIVGADVWIPLSGSWALQNDFAFLIPKQGRGSTLDSNGMPVGGQVRETWGVAMNLVWYPGRSARCVGSSCYRPVLNVADNSQFMVNETISQ